MSKERSAFMVRILPANFPKINIGGNVTLDGCAYRVTSIQDVRVTPTGQIEVKGWCKPVRGGDINCQ